MVSVVIVSEKTICYKYIRYLKLKFDTPIVESVLTSSVTVCWSDPAEADTGENW